MSLKKYAAEIISYFVTVCCKRDLSIIRFPPRINSLIKRLIMAIFADVRVLSLEAL